MLMMPRERGQLTVYSCLSYSLECGNIKLLCNYLPKKNIKLN
jgi:hypothetical protein